MIVIADELAPLVGFEIECAQSKVLEKIPSESYALKKISLDTQKPIIIKKLLNLYLPRVLIPHRTVLCRSGSDFANEPFFEKHALLG